MHFILPAGLVSLVCASVASGVPTLDFATRDANLDKCLANAHLNFSSGSKDPDTFNKAIKPFNKRLPFKPIALVTPTSPSEVGSAVKCASDAKIAVSARGGGHAYNAAGIGGQDGSLIVDMKKFNSISVDGNGIASVGGGSKLGDVALTLWNNAKVGLAHGVCPFVGVGGHAGYGGYGYAGRMWGLLSDQVSSLDVVLANGNATTITPTSDPDLFFAFTGAAPSFGIVTTYHLKTHKAPQNAVQFHYRFNNISTQDETAIVSSVQDWVGSTDDPIPAELGLSMNIGVGNTDVYGAFYGSDSDFDPLINKLLNAKTMPKGVSPNITRKNMNWVQSVQDFAGNQGLNTSTQTDYTDDFYATSLLTPQDRLLSKDAIGSFVEYLNREGPKSNTVWFVEVNTYGGAKSAIANKDLLSKSSFAYRQHLFNFQLYASSSSFGPPYPKNGISFVQGMRTAITSKMPKDTAFGFYANYPDTELKDYGKGYWGDHYSKLQGIKAKVDPHNIFTNPQSVKAA